MARDTHWKSGTRHYRMLHHRVGRRVQPCRLSGRTNAHASTGGLRKRSPRSSSAPQSRRPAMAPRALPRSGSFADRPLAVKFGLLVGVVVLTFAVLLTTLMTSNAAVRR